MADYEGAHRTVGTSAVNTTQTVSYGPGKAGRLRMVQVSYSGPTVQTVTVTLNSGAGTAYDFVLNTITPVSGTPSIGSYVPATPIPINADDAIDVTAPQVAAVTSSIAIYVERQI